MARSEKIVCASCGRPRPESEFFKMRDGSPCPECKECLLSGVDNSDPATFEPLLERFDVPYLPRRWAEIANREYSKSPRTFGPMSVFGKYLRLMRMSQYSGYRYADGPALCAQAPSDDGKSPAVPRSEALAGGAGFAGDAFTENARAEADLSRSLTDEDRSYLLRKWGASYTPAEWVRMEDMYSRYSSEYDLSVDREEVLRKLCRTSLKMDQALDADDMLGYKGLAQVFESLRKSCSFTESQRRDDRAGQVSSVGQLVALCEREGGAIPQMPDPDEYPQDKIDLTINDFKQYSVSLLRNEPNISGLIEAYVAKLDEADERNRKMMESIDGMRSQPNVEPDPSTVTLYGADPEDDTSQHFTPEEYEKIMALMRRDDDGTE